MTRKNVFEIIGLEYSIEKLRKKENDFTAEQIRKGVLEFHYPPDIDSDRTVERHITFDFICGVNGSNRSEQDSIGNDIFDRLIFEVKKLEYIKNIVDKLIAHASTPESRKLKPIENYSILEIVQVVVGLIKLSNFIEHYILNKGMTQYTFQTDMFEIFNYMDQPLAKMKNIDDLMEKWTECQNEFSKGSDFSSVLSLDNFIDNIFTTKT